MKLDGGARRAKHQKLADVLNSGEDGRSVLHIAKPMGEGWSRHSECYLFEKQEIH